MEDMFIDTWKLIGGTFANSKMIFDPRIGKVLDGNTMVLTPSEVAHITIPSLHFSVEIIDGFYGFNGG